MFLLSGCDYTLLVYDRQALLNIQALCEVWGCQETVGENRRGALSCLTSRITCAFLRAASSRQSPTRDKNGVLVRLKAYLKSPAMAPLCLLCDKGYYLQAIWGCRLPALPHPWWIRSIFPSLQTAAVPDLSDVDLAPAIFTSPLDLRPTMGFAPAVLVTEAGAIAVTSMLPRLSTGLRATSPVAYTDLVDPVPMIELRPDHRCGVNLDNLACML